MTLAVAEALSPNKPNQTLMHFTTLLRYIHCALDIGGNLKLLTEITYAVFGFSVEFHDETT